MWPTIVDENGALVNMPKFKLKTCFRSPESFVPILCYSSSRFCALLVLKNQENRVPRSHKLEHVQRIQPYKADEKFSSSVHVNRYVRHTAQTEEYILQQPQTFSFSLFFLLADQKKVNDI